MIEIRIYRDGDQICAIIGDMPEEKAVGFGDCIEEAMKDLMFDMDGKPWEYPF